MEKDCSDRNLLCHSTYHRCDCCSSSCGNKWPPTRSDHSPLMGWSWVVGWYVSPFNSGSHSESCSEEVLINYLLTAVIAACLASFRSLYTASRNERLKEASRNENKTGSFQNMSDGINIPLRQSPSQETQKDRNEAPYWSTSASGNMDDLVQIRTHWS